MKNLFIFISLLIGSLSIHASEADSTLINQELSEEEWDALYQAYADSIEQTLHYEHGMITLKNNIATINIPSGFKYLNGEDSEMIITDIWGNPPSDEVDRSLGMLIPKDMSPLSDSMYAINITYSTDGYIDDSDAKDIDYDELLTTMKESMEEGNEYRIQAGYEPMELVGWASTPFYDEAEKKLHWAKELKFGEMEENTLNYNIRILGRKGFLQLNAIGEMYVLDDVKNNITSILASVNFTDGNKYSDFDPSIDNVAAYGIGALIAGKMLAKVGILAKLGIILAKFWKVIALALVGFGSVIKRFFFGNKEEEIEEVVAEKEKEKEEA